MNKRNQFTTLWTILLLIITLNVNGQLPSIKYLGTYNGSGTPDYLEPIDEDVTSDFVDRISSAVPENMPVPDYHPSYLNNNYNADIRLIEEADVYISFVLEGAGYRNVLGFYSYPTGNPPATVSEIDTVTIIFPNVSRLNSGGELLPGNRVNIGHFDAGTTVAFVVFANGWNGSVATYGKWQHYSDKHLNPPSDTTYKQHSIVLYDNITNRHVISFEDITRPGGDRDFNDAVFFGTTNPASAALTQNTPGLPIVWTGDVNSAWSDPNNWNPNVVPDSTSSITISADAPNDPYLPEDIEVVELVVEPGASINSDPDANLTVTGDYTSNSEVTTNLTFAGEGDHTIYGEGTINDLTIENGNQVIINDPISVEGNLILEDGDVVTNDNLEIVSSSTENGMILQEGGDIIGDITFRRIIPNKTGYHYLSSPITDATLADINDDFTLLSLGGDLTSSPFPNIYIYDETVPSHENTDGWIVPSGLDYPMTPGVGFATHINANVEVDVTGTPNNGDIDVALTHTFSGELPEDWDRCPPDGWNLVGNPYPSAIDWELVEKTGAIHPGVHMWNPFYNKYATYFNGISINEGTNRIAAFQGFFVRSDSIGDTLKFRNSQRILDTIIETRFFKKAEKEVFKLAITMDDYFDETAIYLSPDKEDGYNENLDNFKIETTSHYSPLIFIQDARSQFTIKSLNEFDYYEDIVNLTFFAPKNGNYTLTKKQFDWNTYNAKPLIRDKSNGFIIDLSQSDYTFKSNSGTYEDRFEIFFQPFSVGTNEITGDFSVTLVNNQLRIVGEKSFNSVLIYDLTGKVIHNSYKLTTTSYEWNINGGIASGVYIAHINDGKNNYSYKFAVK